MNQKKCRLVLRYAYWLLRENSPLQNNNNRNSYHLLLLSMSLHQGFYLRVLLARAELCDDVDRRLALGAFCNVWIPDK